VGLERGPLSLVSTTEELRGIRNNGFGLESPETGRRNPSRCPHGTLYPQNLVLTFPTSGGRSVSIVRSRTHATEFSSFRLNLKVGCLHPVACTRSGFLSNATQV
jgi:hypothetical protein